MKAEELMAGNWVKVLPSGLPIRVAAVHHKKVAYHAYVHKLTWVREGLLKPIPLTGEILEKNGFVLQVVSAVTKEYHYILGDDTDDMLFVTINKNTGFVKIYYCPIDTIRMIDVNIPRCGVHQLQQALSLAGIKKNIILKSV